MASPKVVAAAALAIVVVLALLFEARAQGGCPSAASMIDCRSAVTAVNVPPSETCCSQVQKVLQQNGPACLCSAMTSQLAKSLGVLPAQAVMLPSECQKLMGLQYTKNYNCAGMRVP